MTSFEFWELDFESMFISYIKSMISPSFNFSVMYRICFSLFADNIIYY